jgi:hypothetical protein
VAAADEEAARVLANVQPIDSARGHWLQVAEEFDEMAGTLRAIALDLPGDRAPELDD